MASADPMPAFIKILEDDAAVAALTGGAGERIFGGELPRSEALLMPRELVLLQYAGFAPGLGTVSKLEVLKYRVDALCYGETPQLANALRQAVHDAYRAVDRIVKQSVLVHDVQISGGPIPGRDPDQDWPFSLETFAIMVSECAVT